MKLKGTIATLITTAIISFQSVYAINPGLPDTTFKKDNPQYFYTIRDFYVDVPESCIGNSLCLKEFYLVFTFNVGMNSAQEVKQIGFKDADLEFHSKKPADKSFVKQTFTKYESVSSQNGWVVKVTFFPDKTNSSLPASVTRCEFDGKVAAQHMSGNLIFYSGQNELSRIIIY